MAGWTCADRKTIKWDGVIQAEFFNGDGSQLTNLPAPDLSGYVPYSGATGNIDLGQYGLFSEDGSNQYLIDNYGIRTKWYDNIGETYSDAWTIANSDENLKITPSYVDGNIGKVIVEADLDILDYNIADVDTISGSTLTVTGYYATTYTYQQHFNGKPAYQGQGGSGAGWWIYWNTNFNKWHQYESLSNAADLTGYAYNDTLIGSWTGGIGGVNVQYAFSADKSGNIIATTLKEATQTSNIDLSNNLLYAPSGNVAIRYSGTPNGSDMMTLTTDGSSVQRFAFPTGIATENQVLSIEPNDMYLTADGTNQQLNWATDGLIDLGDNALKTNTITIGSLTDSGNWLFYYNAGTELWLRTPGGFPINFYPNNAPTPVLSLGVSEAQFNYGVNMNTYGLTNVGTINGIDPATWITSADVPTYETDPVYSAWYNSGSPSVTTLNGVDPATWLTAEADTLESVNSRGNLTTDNTYDLGTSSYWFKDGYFKGDVFFGDTSQKIYGTASDSLNLDATEINFYIGSTNQIKVNDGALLPETSVDVDLGSSTYYFKTGYFSDGTRTTTITDATNALTATDGTNTCNLCDGTYGVNANLVNASTDYYINGSQGLTQTIPLAPDTTIGQTTAGSMTFTGGILTAYTAAS